MIDQERRNSLRLLAATAGIAAVGARLAFGSATGSETGANGSSAAGKSEAESRTHMLRRNIPSSAEELPVIGLGTWQTFDVGSSASERKPLAEVLETFVKLGGRLVDSSPMYGRSEVVLGDLARELNLHSHLFLATKVWTQGRQEGISQMQSSLHKLRTETLDLMQVHNLVDVKTHLETLAQWKKEGRIRYVGITHYTASAHQDVARLIEKQPVDFVQINYSVAEREAEKRLLPLAQEKGVAVIANRPFASGGLFRRLRDQPVPEWAADLQCESWAQLLLKFVVSHPAVTCTIPATSKVKHLRDNMQAGLGPLPDSALRERIAQLL